MAAIKVRSHLSFAGALKSAKHSFCIEMKRVLPTQPTLGVHGAGLLPNEQRAVLDTSLLKLDRVSEGAAKERESPERQEEGSTKKKARPQVLPPLRLPESLTSAEAARIHGLLHSDAAVSKTLKTVDSDWGESGKLTIRHLKKGKQRRVDLPGGKIVSAASAATAAAADRVLADRTNLAPTMPPAPSVLHNRSRQQAECKLGARARWRLHHRGKHHGR